MWAAHQLASTDKRHWNPASTNNTSGLLAGPEYSSDDIGDGPAVDDADLDELTCRVASNDMGVFKQVAIDQAEADVAKEKMNSLDTTKATTLKASLWDLLPPDLEREILELARGLEILESAEEAAAMVESDALCALVQGLVSNVTEPMSGSVPPSAGSELRRSARIQSARSPLSTTIPEQSNLDNHPSWRRRRPPHDAVRACCV